MMHRMKLCAQSMGPGQLIYCFSNGNRKVSWRESSWLTKDSRFSYRAKPMMHEFFVKPRSVELCVKLLSGCVSKRDERLRSIEMVSAIELIEHLTNDVLEQFPATVFGFINPRVSLMCN